MESDLHSLVERLHRVLPALEALTAEPTAQVSGVTQSTDAVSVMLAADGLPLRIEVHPDWRRTVGLGEFARVVTEVCQETARARADVVADAVSADQWPERFAALLGYLTGEAPPPPDLPPAVALPPTRTRESGALPALVADLVRASAAVGEVAAAVNQPGARAVGTGGRGRLVLVLHESGALRCSADPDWVAGRDTQELNDALAAAVAELRAARAATADQELLQTAKAVLAVDGQASTGGR
ncbi:hypothetical protein GCM10023322_28020 [Rugosimonospora acidiphila]|uniref:YbaB/EbfC DNA-binding family protein n=1 Tax=Rugosimonospora acidiphila TaxID=556531 RepID=A0ABP9RRK0_9ACTN